MKVQRIETGCFLIICVFDFSNTCHVVSCVNVLVVTPVWLTKSTFSNMKSNLILFRILGKLFISPKYSKVQLMCHPLYLLSPV